MIQTGQRCLEYHRVIACVLKCVQGLVIDVQSLHLVLGATHLTADHQRARRLCVEGLHVGEWHVTVVVWLLGICVVDANFHILLRSQI